MRLGVIDVGSNTVHLLVVDAHRGAQPIPAFSHKRELRLSEHTTSTGDIAQEGVAALIGFVEECKTIAEDQGAEQLLAFATSAIREAPNGEGVLKTVHDKTGIHLQVLSGEQESSLTFLAVRRWFGWSSGRLIVIDIGGGSLELANGQDEVPDAAISLPLGAGRLTRTLQGDPPAPEDLRAMRKQVRTEIARSMRDLTRFGRPDHVVGTSKTIRSLARLCGAAPKDEGPYVERTLERADLTKLVPRLAKMTAAERAGLPGVSASRSAQMLAGAVVIEGTMELLDVPALTLCPWALREGVILRRLDAMDGWDAAE
ncbi:Ppx/GppA phosphatase family protein [Allobranchiibius huperziae]|uniref:Exopolyphosphatase/guanosine-5'-triphosphate, 3'-diphosphate pyrophosphatase n=1 Tax=Allobranchiibius huperziae TaxID=1874116 RepID=A0A853D7W8_9MICO|nr:Ppx/GppA phosphatase family protein [Allobranchiibius huperziae]NYJ73496.1 exopolyphosphatase/guanosine-5'-triphosphate,3'-diphosphate pyrophosphatase [Allobranchiibius huperziae]